VVFEDLVIAPGRDSAIYAIRIDDGTEIWRLEFPEAVTTQPLLVDSFVVFGTYEQVLFFVSARTGAIVQRHALSLSPYLGMAHVHGRIIMLGCVPHDDEPQDVIAFDIESSRVAWQRRLDSTASKAFWYVPRVATCGENVLVGSTEGDVVAYSIDRGSELWRYNVGDAIRGIGCSDSMLYIGTLDGILHAVRRAN
jgi:outer membrane protein assembly factor BamB